MKHNHQPLTILNHLSIDSLAASQRISWTCTSVASLYRPGDTAVQLLGVPQQLGAVMFQFCCYIFLHLHFEKHPSFNRFKKTESLVQDSIIVVVRIITRFHVGKHALASYTADTASSLTSWTSAAHRHAINQQMKCIQSGWLLDPTKKLLGFLLW